MTTTISVKALLSYITVFTCACWVTCLAELHRSIYIAGFDAPQVECKRLVELNHCLRRWEDTYFQHCLHYWVTCKRYGTQRNTTICIQYITILLPYQRPCQYTDLSVYTPLQSQLLVTYTRRLLTSIMETWLHSSVKLRTENLDQIYKNSCSLPIIFIKYAMFACVIE